MDHPPPISVMQVDIKEPARSRQDFMAGWNAGIEAACIALDTHRNAPSRLAIAYIKALHERMEHHPS